MLNQKKVCRVCLKTGPRLMLLFVQPTTTAADEISLAHMISQCTDYKISQEDEFPQLICKQCVKGAHAAYDFKKLYESSHHTLTELLASVKKNTEQDFKPSVADRGWLKTEKLSATHLIKLEQEATSETEFFDTIEMRSETEASSTSSETRKEIEFSRTVCPDYVQESELIIKDENQTYDETEESNIGFTVNAEENDKQTCSANGDEIFPAEKVKSEEDESYTDSYHSNDIKHVNLNKCQKNDERDIHRRKIDAENPYKCLDCNKSFSSVSNLNRHKKWNTCYKPHKCQWCSKSFAVSDNLKHHTRIHTDEKLYICQCCSKSYASLNSLHVHKRLLSCGIHTDEKPYKCKDCGKTFAHSSILKCHERIHTGEKPYKCQCCSKSFARLSSFNVHKRIHTGEKPYKCKDCGKAFTSSCVLKCHKRLHTGEKPYKCQYCSKSFAQLSNLNVHKRSHAEDKRFKCQDSNTTFSNLSNLNTHKRIHEKPFKCLDCNKAFGKLSNLNTHKKMHAGRKPYKCEECSVIFSYSSTLNRHKKRIHADDINQINVMSPKFHPI